MKTTKRYLTEMCEMYGLPKELYTMKRALKQKGDLRWDITIIPPLIINGQFNKTKGHTHDCIEDYYVLEGEAIFAIQSPEDKFSFIRKHKGGHFRIPANYYHITINPSKTETLKLGNWMSDKYKSDYKLIEKMKGMKLYYTTKGWVKNPNYK